MENPGFGGTFFGICSNSPGSNHIKRQLLQTSMLLGEFPEVSETAVIFRLHTGHFMSDCTCFVMTCCHISFETGIGTALRTTSRDTVRPLQDGHAQKKVPCCEALLNVLSQRGQRINTFRQTCRGRCGGPGYYIFIKALIHHLKLFSSRNMVADSHFVPI